MSSFPVLRHCRFLIGLLPAAAGLFCGAGVASARVEQRARTPAPLEVRYKTPVRNESDRTQAGKGPFALLAAFPEAVARGSTNRETEGATIRIRTAGTSLMRGGGNPLPTKNGVLSSRFGMRKHPLLGGWRPHHGVDLAAPAGTPVHATTDGIVRAAGRRGGYGLAITLEHGQGLETRYGHMSRINVVRGQSVRKGSVIGWVGSTGRSTGPHLHYETRVRGRPVDPLRYMRR